MSFKGWFDSELRKDGWFDSELKPPAWFDPEIVDTTNAEEPYVGVVAAVSSTTANLSTQHRFAAAVSASSSTTVALTTGTLLGTATASCTASASATVTVPLWQQVSTGVYEQRYVKLTDSLFYGGDQNAIGQLSGGVMTWYAQDAYPNGIVGASFVAIAADKIFGFGGYTDYTYETAVANTYIGTVSGTTVTWAAATSLPWGKVGANAIKLADGRVLIANGSSPPSDPSTHYPRTFATISGTTITYETDSDNWENWNSLVQLADGRLLAATPFHSYSPNFYALFQLVSISGTELTTTNSYCDDFVIPQNPDPQSGWLTPGFCKLGDGRVLIGGGKCYDGSQWVNFPYIYEVTVIGDTVSLTQLVDMPYMVAPGDYPYVTFLPIATSGLFVGAPGYGEHVRTIPASYSPELNAAVGAAASATAALTTTPVWTDIGGDGTYFGLGGVLAFDDTHFFQPYQGKVGVLSGGTVTWYSTNAPDATYTAGHGYCILDSTHILCTGGSNAGNSAGVGTCWVGTLSGNSITWAAAGNMAATRSYHTLSKLADGRVLVNGGYNYGYTGAKTDSEFLTLSSYSVTSADVYASGTNADIAPNKAVLPDGRLVWVYNYGVADTLWFSFLTISGNTFTRTDASVGVPGGGEGHYGVGFVRKSDGRMFAGGGYSSVSPYPARTDIYEITISGTTVTRSSLPVSATPVVEPDGTRVGLLEGPNGDLIYYAESTTGMYQRPAPAGAYTLMAAAPAAQGTTSAALTTAVRLAATVASLATASAPLRVGVTVAASLSATPAITAALSTGQGFASAVSATPAVSAALTTGIRLAAAPTATATVTPPALTTDIRLAATPVAAASTTAALSSGVRLAGTCASAPTASAALTTGIRLAAGSSAVASVTAPLTTAFNLSATPAATPATTAAMSSGIQLAAVAQAVATRLAADLTVPGGAAQLASIKSATSTVAGELATQIVLAGGVASSAVVAAPLSAQIRLEASQADTAAVSGALTASIRLAASASAVPTATAALPSAVHALSASVAAGGTYVAGLSAQIRLAGAVSATPAVPSASLSAIIRLAGTLESLSTVGGTLTASIRLAAEATIVQSIEAQLEGTIAPAALKASAASLSSAGATITTRIDLAGAGYAAVTATGELVTQITLQGALSAASVARGRLYMSALFSDNSKYVLIVPLEAAVLTTPHEADILPVRPRDRTGVREIAA